MRTLVYTFKCKFPAEHDRVIIDREISGGHKYYNMLIEIEREHLAKKEAVRKQFLPGLAEAQDAIAVAEQAVESAREEIKSRNADMKKRTATAADRERVKNLRADLKEVRDVRKAILATVQDNPIYLSALETLHQELLTAKREAYAQAQCSWGTRLKIAQAVELALTVENPLTGKRMPRGTDDPPKFRHWTGDGIVAVQLQNGLAAQRAMLGQDSRLQMEYPVDARSQRRARLVTFRLRVGSTEDRKPIWLTVPAHEQRERPLPADGKIMWACVVRRRGPARRRKDATNPLGVWRPYDEFQVQLTVRTNEEKPQAQSGVCGIDLGWRLMDDGSLRVAYWSGSDGEHGDVRIEPGAFRIVDDLKSISGGKLMDMKTLLARWLADKTELPEWLEEARTVGQWHSPERFCRLVDRWQRINGDDGLFPLLQQWREKTAHLKQWERSQESKAQRARLDLYRKLAAQLSRRYRLLVVEDCDWRKLNRLPTTETNKSVNETARRHMRYAAVGLLRQCIDQSGAIKEWSKTENTTRECCKCGHVNACTCDKENKCECGWRNHETLVMKCQCCGETWDQDQNASLILLARGKAAEIKLAANSMQPSSDNGDGVEAADSTTRNDQDVARNGNAASGPKKGGRWQRRKVSRSQKSMGPQQNASLNDIAGAISAQES